MVDGRCEVIYGFSLWGIDVQCFYSVVLYKYAAQHGTDTPNINSFDNNKYFMHTYATATDNETNSSNTLRFLFSLFQFCPIEFDYYLV